MIQKRNQSLVFVVSLSSRFFTTTTLHPPHTHDSTAPLKNTRLLGALLLGTLATSTTQHQPKHHFCEKAVTQRKPNRRQKTESSIGFRWLRRGGGGCEKGKAVKASQTRQLIQYTKTHTRVSSSTLSTQSAARASPQKKGREPNIGRGGCSRRAISSEGVVSFFLSLSRAKKEGPFECSKSSTGEKNALEPAGTLPHQTENTT